MIVRIKYYGKIIHLYHQVLALLDMATAGQRAEKRSCHGAVPLMRQMGAKTKQTTKSYVFQHHTDGKNLFRLKGREQNSSLLVSVLNDRNLSHQCIPLSFFVALSFWCNVISRKNANMPATKGSDENGTFIMSLNCNNMQNCEFPRNKTMFQKVYC